MSNTRATVEITATSSKLSAALSAARAKVSGWASSMARDAGRIGTSLSKRLEKALSNKSLGKVATSAAGNFLGNMGARGMDALVNTAKDVQSFERNLQRLGIAGSLTTTQLNAMRQQVRNISRDTGVADAEILSGAQTYVDLTGDIAGASAAMNSFARIAQASGASVDDVAQATSALQQSMGLDAKDIEAVWSGLIVQGKAGAVSVKDMAGQLATLGPMMAQFKGGATTEGIRSMGAAFQVVRRGSGSANEASTKLQSLIGSIIKNAPKLESVLGKGSVLKFNKETGKRELQDFEGIIKRIGDSKLMRDPVLLGKKLGNDKESLQAINMLTKEIALFDELKSAASDTGAVQRDLNTYLSSDAGKIDQAFNSLKVTLAEAFTPERIQAFVGALQKLVDVLVAAVSAASKLVETIDIKGASAKFGEDVGKRRALAKRHLSADEKMREADRLQMQANQKYGQYGRDQLSPDEVAAQAALEAEARALRSQGDRWANVAARTDGKPVAPLNMGSADKLAQTIGNAVRDALGVKQTINVDVGKDKVVRAVRSSRTNNTRPPQ